MHTPGPVENLTYETVTDPAEPAPGQVRTAVAAACVHLLDGSPERATALASATGKKRTRTFCDPLDR